MKKTIVTLVLWLFGLIGLWLTTVSAKDDFTWWVDSLLGEETFGYSSSDKIEVVSISKDSVEIESPVVQDEAWFDILDYAILYGQHPIAEAMENPSLLDNFGEKEISLNDNPGSTFTITLNTTDDNLDSDKIYYALLLPKDEFGLPGEISNDICFSLNNQVYGEWTDCGESWAVHSAGGHSAGGADMNLANITHTVDGDSITLRWTALEGADKIELFLRDPDDERFKSLDTVAMDDEEYKFRTDRNGEHNIKFIPMNGNSPAGTETIYTLTVTTVPQWANPTPDTSTTTTTTVGITKVPVVGPKENMILVIIISIFAYFVYRLFLRRKLKN